jgi:hypothetical protein
VPLIGARDRCDSCVRVCSELLIRYLLDLVLPAHLAEGTVAQELEASDAHCALPVLRRLAHKPEFDRLWDWIA